jgi:phosphoribosylformimino-5-aminoimidazole carboxamide ribotide isomerase
MEGGDPLELARAFAASGAARLHLVDLDGAFSGVPSTGLLERLLAAGLPIQVGGGYRTIDAVATALAAGADRVMLGTAALDPGFREQAIARFGAERLVVAIDARDGRVAVDGWVRTSETTPAQLARDAATSGAARLLVTSASRDGSLEGPDLPLLRSVLAVRVPVLAAGGMASIDDLVALRELGCEGAVVGTALLAGRFTLAAAIAATS